MTELLTGAETMMCEAAADESSDVVLLIAALDALLEHARPLSADGFYLHGSELLAHIIPLSDRGYHEISEGVLRITGMTGSDEEIVAELAPGEVTLYQGERWYLPEPLRYLRARLLELHNLQAKAGVLVVADADGGYGYTVMDLDA